jgi:seryl-tRNA synthetase
MLDIQFIRDNPDLVAKKAKEKAIQVDLKTFKELDARYTELLQIIESERASKNDQARFVAKEGVQDPAIRAKGKAIKEKLAKLETEFAEVSDQRAQLLQAIPNIHPDDTPLGGEEANKPEKHVGPAIKKTAKDHQTWAEEKGLLDFERGAKVAGSKFYYTKGALVELEYACIQFALSVAIKHGFTPMSVPHMVNEKTANGTGFSPRGEEDQIYSIVGEDLSLIATAEIPITGYHAGEILDAKDLPVLYVGISPAYRKEAGAYGKHSKGLYRVHQFNKVEMYVFCEGTMEESGKWHKKLVAIEEELCKALEIPYQLVRIAAGDLGAPVYKKYDIEYWSPVDGAYHELMSCSNVTDYQARRLKIRYKNTDGKNQLVHTLNGTAMAFSRVAIALIENHQTKDGNVAVPKVLQPFMSGKKEIK